MGELAAVLREAGFDADFLPPWSEGTARKVSEDPHNFYADYEAWEEWMGSEVESGPCSFPDEADCRCISCDFYRWWEDFGMLDRIMLYSLMWMVVKRTERGA